MDFLIKLDKLIENKGVSKNKMLMDLGLSKNSYLRWKKGQSPKLENLKKICQYFDVELDYFTSTHLPIEGQNNGTVQIPIIGIASAGSGCYAEQHIYGYETIPKTNINVYKDYTVIKIKGDSMNPDFQEGDNVLVEVQPMVESGDIAVVIIDGEDALIKQVYFTKSNITLVSFNSKYPPKIYEKKEMNRVKIFGKVITLLRHY